MELLSIKSPAPAKVSYVNHSTDNAHTYEGLYKTPSYHSADKVQISPHSRSCLPSFRFAHFPMLAEYSPSPAVCLHTSSNLKLAVPLDNMTITTSDNYLSCRTS